MANATKKRLVDILERFPGTPITVVGDLILDAYVFGRVNRISPEAPVVVVEVVEESKRPGGAGNVVSNLIALGAKATVLGVTGTDSAGSEIEKILGDGGGDVTGILHDKNRPTSVKTRVIAHSQQVVRVDREVTSPISSTLSASLLKRLETELEHTRGVIFSDYGKGTLNQGLFTRLVEWREAGRIGLKKIPVVVDPKAPNFSMYRGSSVIKPNRKEAEEATGLKITNQEDAVRAGELLLKNWNCEMVLITLGEDGMVLVSSENGGTSSVKIDTTARDVYDVSGAGDTVSAVFTLALAVGAAPADAARLANIAAGIVVAEVGTVAVSAKQLREELEPMTE